MQATIQLDPNFNVGPVDPRLFGSFIEHLGRAVYEGIYDPGNPLSDENGFRRDVIDALKPLRMPLIRYPGGNFVSAYDWRDGVGPRDKRPVRLDYAWHSIEPNTFGTDEFMAWCTAAGTAPMMAVNLGTAGAKEAAALLEYCNLPTGTAWADQRAANGHPQPYAVKLWCLGNEMDGPWQAGHVPADEYARRAQQAGKLMKGLDSSIELIACGSSGRSMPTYLDWDREVLEFCWDEIDYVSAHRYSAPNGHNSAWYLAEGVEIDRVIEDYTALFGYVRGMKRSQKRIYLSFDEWNAWDMSRFPGFYDGAEWQKAPHLLEQVYNLQDALVCAQYLTSFLRHADVVKIACLAQAVNVIAPILTKADGILLQSIYHPFALTAQNARGLSLKPVIDSPCYSADDRTDVPLLDAAATYDPADGQLSVFLVNRSERDDLSVQIKLAGAQTAKILGVDVFSGDDPLQMNTWEQPEALKPRNGQASLNAEGGLQVKVPHLGYVVVRANLA